MAHPDIERLRSIKTFPSLVKYLREELEWPIESDDVEDLTFEYEAEELGIDPKTAAKIQEIKQLRPMDAKQPWGIFFVKFEPRRLPVVVLRKILNQLVIKKRAAAGKAMQAAWHQQDLLFISSYGEQDERQITFAHFTQDLAGKDLPTLKVLGWDGRDTALHIDKVVQTLKTNFRWPRTFNVDQVRECWSSAFEYRHREVITTASELAERLAVLASRIRGQVLTVMAYESEKGPIRQLHAAFRAALVHDLEPDGFADMYAQTIAYGLLSARIADPTKTTLDDFAAHMRTNPFLRELMETFLRIGGRRGKVGGPGIDFDELGVSEVVELLDEANMDAVIRDFGDKNRSEDPVMHFFEGFLSAYDAKAKKDRGVFYTPQPVVSYIVRSVHELLQTEFGLADGLADTTTWGEMLGKIPGLKLPPLTDEPGEKRTISPDEPFVQILDPATGTATFPVEVIEVIHQTLQAKWKRMRLTETQQMEAWNDYVPKHLLPRLHAFELMMAPYAIAHMKIGLKLAETGYRFGTDERARIFLTNALEPWAKQPILVGFDALAHEAAAVNEIKRYKRFTVVIGNPPYSNFGQLNRIPFILNLLYDYKRELEEKKINLDDDFIKFIRFSQYLLDQAGSGVLGMITNNAFFDGPTHRRMRESLLGSFEIIRAINLHGSLKKGETAPDGSKDENVFDITVGVGISIFAKVGRRGGASASDLFGSRNSKYDRLTSDTALALTPLSLAAPAFFFVPKDFSSAEEYRSSPSIPEIFPSGISGIKTHRDELLVEYSREQLVERFQEIARNSNIQILKEQFGIEDTAYWTLAKAKRHIREDSVKTKVQRYFYRPFDYRHIYYEPDIIERGDARWSVMQHMLQHNLSLICTRQTNPGDFTEILVSDALVDKRALASFAGEARAYPLYIYEDVISFESGMLNTSPASPKSSRPNLGVEFLNTLSDRLKLPQEGPHGLPIGVTPEAILYYAYAVFHSPCYRSSYAEFLKVDFPRLPLTGSLDLFLSLAKIGGELTAMHLLESPKLAQPITKFIGNRAPEVEKVSWSSNTVWLNKTKKTGFQGVPEDVWNFCIGGYQACDKWLKDRKGRVLSDDDIAHYQKIVVALSGTIRLMAEIDEVIEAHGGWPGAFKS